MLAVQVLGRRAGLPAPGEPSSGYLVRAGTATILLDCGPGVAGELRGALGGGALDGVFISHLHVDHGYDLVPVAKTLLSPHVTYPRAGEEMRLTSSLKPVPCHLPPGGAAAFRVLQNLFPVRSSPQLDSAFDLVFDPVDTVAGGWYEVGGCEVTAVAVRHAVPAFGFRLQSAAGSLAYTGDTGWTDSLVELAAGVDLLLCEATLREPDDGPHGHLCAVEAGRLAAEADVAALLLTHVISSDEEFLAAQLADAAASYGGPILLAAPRTTIAFQRTDGASAA